MATPLSSIRVWQPALFRETNWVFISPDHKAVYFWGEGYVREGVGWLAISKWLAHQTPSGHVPRVFLRFRIGRMMFSQLFRPKTRPKRSKNDLLMTNRIFSKHLMKLFLTDVFRILLGITWAFFIVIYINPMVQSVKNHPKKKIQGKFGQVRSL